MGKLTKAGFARAKRELGLKGKLTRKQVQRVFKRAIKNLGRKSPSKSRSKSSKTSSTKRKTKSNPKGGKNRMGRKGKSFVQTAYKLIPALALAAPGLSAAFGTGNTKYKVTTAVKYYTGYNMDLKMFIWSDFAVGWTPFVAASLATKGIQKLNGLIRRI